MKKAQKALYLLLKKNLRRIKDGEWMEKSSINCGKRMNHIFGCQLHNFMYNVVDIFGGNKKKYF